MKELESEFYRNLLEHIDLGVYFVDCNREITFFNEKSEKITGYKKEEVIGKACVEDIFQHIDSDGNQLCISGCPLKSTIEDGISRTTDVFLYHKNGYRIPIRIHSSQIKDEKGNVIGAVETFKDMSLEVEIEKENNDLKELAMVDELTDLPNRRCLEEWLIARHREFNKFDRTYGVLIIDIDNFKNINDNYGHLTGDKMLKIVSKTLKSVITSHGVAARLGGEEFVIVASDVNAEKLHQLGKRICSLVFHSTLEVGDTNISVSVSIGGAIVNKHDDIQSLMKRADTYMYKAKTSGKSRVYTEYGEDKVEVELNSSKQLNFKILKNLQKKHII